MVRYGTARARWVILASVLGSGIAFLDSTVVNVALPSIARDLGAGLSGLQWTLTAYLLTLGSFLVLGGSLGDLFGRRRVFVTGLVGFTVASALCGAAPSTGTLIAARAVQGVAAALLVPTSLAIISASFHPDDRGRAIGAWAGLGGIATAVGPFVGGWLIDAASWRLVFLINVPLAAIAVAVTLRHVPETRDEEADRRLDFAGAAALSLGLAGLVYAVIEGSGRGSEPAVMTAAVVGMVAIVVFVLVEVRSAHPMVPLSVFRSRQFSGANAVTFVVYAALGATTFLLVLHLQQDLHYSALEAGASLLPVTLLMFAFSARSGALAQRIGPRWPMTVGALVVAAGLALLAGVEPGDAYATGVLPGVLVLGVGLTLTVAPLTATVLAAIEDRHAGVGAAINNAIARIAGLLAIAVLPAAAGLGSGAIGRVGLTQGFRQAMLLAATLAAAGGAIAFATVRQAAAVAAVTQADLVHPCHDPCVREPAPDVAA
jgi:EmrB/QacA subfamily drug resistance transporter